MYLVIRHNTEYVTKVFDVNVSLMGIAESIDEAKDHILSEVNDYIENYIDDDEQLDLRDILETRESFEQNDDGSLSFSFVDNEMSYDIIPVSMGFPEKYITLAGA